MTLRIYVDGSCWPNPGPGGWAAVVVRSDPEGEFVERVLCGNEAVSTNQRMELKAILEALDYLNDRGLQSGHVYSDSQYAINCISRWAPSWERRGWRKADGSEVKNLDLIQAAHEIFPTLLGVKLKWVRGHNGNAWNERADQEANLARMALLTERD